MSKKTKKTNAMTLPLGVTITHPSGGNRVGGEREVRLQIVDQISHTLFLEIRMSRTAFAEALSTAEGWAVGTLRGLGHLGMTLEAKDEMISLKGLNYDYDDFGEKLAPRCKPYEVDGWKARIDERFNHHRGSRDGVYRVSFFRHVPTPEAEVERIFAEGRRDDDPKGALLAEIRAALRDKNPEVSVEELISKIDIEIGTADQ